MVGEHLDPKMTAKEEKFQKIPQYLYEEIKGLLFLRILKLEQRKLQNIRVFHRISDSIFNHEKKTIFRKA